MFSIKQIKVGIGPWLYGFTLDCAWEQAILVRMKTKFLNILCTCYEYFKDSLVLYSDTYILFWFDPSLVKQVL